MKIYIDEKKPFEYISPLPKVGRGNNKKTPCQPNWITY